MIELSVIIPTYGRVDKIKRAIDSALVDLKVEIIVVDDNGKGDKNQENTKSILDEYISSGKIKYFVLDNNSGAGFARNYGVSKAKGKYITFLDDDDFFINNCLLKKLNFFKQQTDSFDICCSHMAIEQHDIRIKTKENRFVGSNAKDFLLDGSCYTSMIMIKKESFLAIDGFFDTPYLQDHTLMLKAYRDGLKVCVFDEEVFVHTLHSDKTITTGSRPIYGVALRCQLEKELSSYVVLTESELNLLQYRWNTITFHSNWINKGRSLGLFNYLIKDIICRSFSTKQFFESLKLLVKFIVKYQYYSK